MSAACLNEISEEKFCDIINMTNNEKTNLDNSTANNLVYNINSNLLYGIPYYLDNSAKANLSRTFNESNLIVVPDNNPIFKSGKLNEKFMSVVSKEPTKRELFTYYSIFNVEKNVANDVVPLGYLLTTGIMVNIVIGLFQLVLLFVSMIIIIALMMAIFFKTMENLDNTIDDFKISNNLGMSYSKIRTTILIESFVCQFLPFVLGIACSILLFGTFFTNPIFKNNEEFFNYSDILSDKTNLAILISIGVILVVILLILVEITIKKVKTAKL
jgi:hypothetical protein